MRFNAQRAQKAEAAARECLRDNRQDAYPSERQMFIAYSNKHDVSSAMVKKYYKRLQSSEPLPGHRSAV